MFYSIVVPTFKRPNEVDEFLASMSVQVFRNFELLIVDGSPDNCLHTVIEQYSEKLNLKYFHERNLGASESRNLGCEKATGDFLVFIDSDCIVPEDYLVKVDNFLSTNKVDAFGGPDREHESFTPTQKAISYAMTSFFTTGGIRGRKKHVGKFHLRGFNMGIKRDVFFKVGGYSGMQVAEDIELSMRLIKSGYITSLIPDAYVYHKRRSTFYKFFRQLFMHGKGRIDLYLRHRDSLKPLHLLPTAFVVFLLVLIASMFISFELHLLTVAMLVFYIFILFLDASIKYRSIYIGFLSMFASLEMLIAYGLGLLYNVWLRLILGKKEESKKALLLKQ